MAERVSRRILITGHLGYVGTVLSPLLATAGHELLGADIDLYRACTIAALPPALPCPVPDFRDLDGADLEHLDTVVHLAGLSNDPLGELNPELTLALNHRAAVALARRCRDAGVRRFVAASTCSIYGSGGEDWLTESAPARPLTAYARAKWQMEQDLLELGQPDFELVILRPGTVFGASPRLRFDLVVNNLIAWALATRRVRLKSDGRAWRPLLHVADLARAILGLIEAPSDRVAGRVFNIGFNSLNLRVIELAKRLAAAMPEADLQVDGAAETDLRSYRVDCSALTRVLTDWQPRYQPEDAVVEIRSLLGHRIPDPEQFEGAALARLAHLRRRMARGEVDAELRRV